MMGYYRRPLRFRLGLGKSAWMGFALSVGLSIGLSLSGTPAWAAAPTALKQGQTYYAKGYVQKAIPMFRKAVEQAPMNAEANLYLGRSLKQQGGAANFAEAAKAFDRVLEVEPVNMEALTGLAQILSWNPHERTRAIQLYQRAYQIDPANAALSRSLVEVLTWEGRLEEALYYAEPIAEQFKTDEGFMASYAFILANRNRPNDAITIYEGLLNIQTTQDVDRLGGYAYALARAGRADEAVQVYEKLMQMTAALPSGEERDRRVLMLAGLAYELGRYQDVLDLDASLPETIRTQKRDIPIRRARCLAKLNQPDEARAAFQELYTAGQLNWQEKMEYADYLFSLRLPLDALPEPDFISKLYEQALQEAGHKSEVYLRMARYYGGGPNVSADAFEKAVGFYEQAIQLEPGSEAKQEYIDYLKTASADHHDTALTHIKALMDQYPDDPTIKAGYAELLSWDEKSRREAMEFYLKLLKDEPQNRAIWQASLEQVLRWHKPSEEYFDLYQQILAELPESKEAWLSVGRMYREQPDRYEEALRVYHALATRYPQDAQIQDEWYGVLSPDEARRPQAISFLKTVINDSPDDMTLQVAYAKLLSYERKYHEAIKRFDTILEKEPNNREALLGKGYTLLWSGDKFKAKDHFSALRESHPDDVDIALGLAEAERSIGRYDRALDLLWEVKQKVEGASSAPSETTPPVSSPPESMTPADPTGMQESLNVDDPDFTQQRLIPCANFQTGKQPVVTYDYSISPVLVASADLQNDGFQSSDETPVVAPAMPVPVAPMDARKLERLSTDVNILNMSMQALQELQQRSQANLNQLESTLQQVNESTPMLSAVGNASTGETLSSTPGQGTRSARPSLLSGHVSPWARMLPVFGQQVTLDDQDALLAGRGKLHAQAIQNLESDLDRVMRPELRGGFEYFTQDGEEETTTQFNFWGFPNQLSLSLTPQLRVRGGVTPRKFYIPDTPLSPDSTWGTQYSLGATAKYWDHLTLDGDISLTHFTQSDSNNFTYQAQAQYDVNDRLSLKVGAARRPLLMSMLAYSGQRPEAGPFDGDLVGQARENAFYGEVNARLFEHVDWNLGYEWAFINGSRIPTNTKNQVYTSLGHTWHFFDDDALRLGYEFLYFGFSKDATNGFFGLSAGDVDDPLVALSPAALAPGSTVFGGYFSPDWFILNAARLDLYGSLWNKFLEYRLGGSLGVQAFDGEGDSPTSMAKAFDGHLVMNMTDWLAAYGDVSFLDSGGAFSRWRFGGGLILRPGIPALSPVIK